MKKLFLETSFRKIYMLGVILISLLILGGYFSYAMFTVSKEKNNAISIITGNLAYTLQVDGEESNVLSVPANTTEEFSVTLSNPNNRVARFNFYYEGSLPSDVTVGYVADEGLNIPPAAVGINLETSGASGSSNTYTIRISNNSNSSVTINLGVGVGLDYNDLSLPSNGHLFEEVKFPTVAELLFRHSLDYSDSEQYFLTGTNPNNYIWYSGKLWRAVSTNPSDNSVKLVTEDTISAIRFDANTNQFENSDIKRWLNDTTEDGFLGNLRDPENFIKTDSKWRVGESAGGNTKPSSSQVVTASVGLLDIYEVNKASYLYMGSDLQWWTLTPYDASNNLWGIVNYRLGIIPYYTSKNNTLGVRPSINLKPNVKVVGGDGTKENPYRLEGDNDTNLDGTKLINRYNGEYVKIGNSLYRIVSKESGNIKVVALYEIQYGSSPEFEPFGTNSNFATSSIKTYLNEDYLNSGFLDSFSNLLVEDSNWYLGTVNSNSSYLLAKYEDINMSSYTQNITSATVGLLRYGELMTGSIIIDEIPNQSVGRSWLITPYDLSNLWINNNGLVSTISSTTSSYIIPSFFLKNTTIITGGTGTKQDPFTIELQ